MERVREFAAASGMVALMFVTMWALWLLAYAAG